RPELDGLRGIAILLVLMLHQTEALRDTGWRTFWSFGWAGVDLFYVLSGFLITGILLDARAQEGFFRRFYWRRVLRILPLYYLWLLFFTVVLPLSGASLAPLLSARHGQLWWWVHLSNWHFAFGHEVPTGISIAWSLSIEEQFYLLW